MGGEAADLEGIQGWSMYLVVFVLMTSDIFGGNCPTV